MKIELDANAYSSPRNLIDLKEYMITLKIVGETPYQHLLHSMIELLSICIIIFDLYTCCRT